MGHLKTDFFHPPAQETNLMKHLSHREWEELIALS